MRTAIRYQHRDGRFGREVRGDDDVQMADARTTMQPGCPEERFATVGYEVDADAVAAAIVSRLLAGRTIPGRRAEGP